MLGFPDSKNCCVHVMFCFFLFVLSNTICRNLSFGIQVWPMIPCVEFRVLMPYVSLKKSWVLQWELPRMPLHNRILVDLILLGMDMQIPIWPMLLSWWKTWVWTRPLEWDSKSCACVVCAKITKNLSKLPEECPVKVWSSSSSSSSIHQIINSKVNFVPFGAGGQQGGHWKAHSVLRCRGRRRCGSQHDLRCPVLRVTQRLLGHDCGQRTSHPTVTWNKGGPTLADNPRELVLYQESKRL